MPVTSISRFVTQHAAANPTQNAVTCGDETITWAELEARANRLARDYLSLGAKPGGFVSIALPNSVEFVVACIAAWKMGATPQLLAWRLLPKEREELLALVQPSFVVGLQDAADRGGLPGVGPNYAPQSTDDAPLPDAIAPAIVAIATGGSTGKPKIVVMADPAVVGDREEAGISNTGIAMRHKGKGEICLIPGPLYHTGPWSTGLSGLLRGGHLVMCEKFDPVETLRTIERHRVTYVFTVPTMMVRIWKLDEALRTSFDLSSVEAWWHAAAPCPDWLKLAYVNWLGGERMWEMFGASDGTASTTINGAEWLTHRGSVGRAVSGEIKILDDAGQPCPPGVIGNIFMRPPAKITKRRYIGAPPPVAHGEWRTLGDLGHMDEEGYLFLADRRSDLIIVGGANIYPAEIEAVLEAHPLVQAVAVVGLPDDDMGKRLHAIVQTEGPLGAETLQAYMADRISKNKIPKSFEFTREPLKYDTGKLRRGALAERAAAALKAAGG
jgi:bile acid-coenzyme A ligase